MEIGTLIRLADDAAEALHRIRSREVGVVMFVDLVGSTDFKAHHPDEDEWLPRLATFLLSVTKIIQANGRVVKYIGDEVMAFFEGDDAVLNAEHAAEQVLQFCDRFQRYKFVVKISLDYGSVSMLDFTSDISAVFGTRDPNGLVVDRCARIMGKTPPHAVLCSGDFRSASAAPRRWRLAGTFKAKGIPRAVKVFQLSYGTCPLVTIRQDNMTLADCLKRLAGKEQQLREQKSMPKGIPRRPRS